MTREPDALAAGTKPERPEPEPNGRDIAHEAIGPPMETAVCVVTRFRLRSPLDLIATYLDFLRIKREVGRFPGLLRVSFLFGGMRTCFTVSIWSGPRAIASFGGSSRSHLAAGHAVMGRLGMSPNGGPEMWSSRWMALGPETETDRLGSGAIIKGQQSHGTGGASDV